MNALDARSNGCKYSIIQDGSGLNEYELSLFRNTFPGKVDATYNHWQVWKALDKFFAKRRTWDRCVLWATSIDELVDKMGRVGELKTNE